MIHPDESRWLGKKRDKSAVRKNCFFGLGGLHYPPLQWLSCSHVSPLLKSIFNQSYTGMGCVWVIFVWLFGGVFLKTNSLRAWTTRRLGWGSDILLDKVRNTMAFEVQISNSSFRSKFQRVRSVHINWHQNHSFYWRIIYGIYPIKFQAKSLSSLVLV